MKVYIDLEGERLPGEVLGIAGSGLDLRGDDWELRGYQGAVYDERGTRMTREELRRAYVRDRAGEIWEQLHESGCLDGLLAGQRLLDRLLDALEGVPLLRSAIAKIRGE